MEIKLIDRGMKIVPESDNAPASLYFDHACFVAMTILTQARSVIPLSGEPFASDPESHPDAHVIANWLSANNCEPDEARVLFWLSYFVRTEWAELPKRTRSEHRKLYKQIALLCSQLREAMDATGSLYVRGGGFGLELAGTRDLMTESEAADFKGSCRAATKTPPRSDEEQGLVSLEPSLPTVQELLDRVAAAAQRLEKRGPIHSQPNKRGAERGYFVRRMGDLLLKRYGTQPHEVIAALTTIALGETTERELVAKLLA